MMVAVVAEVVEQEELAVVGIVLVVEMVVLDHVANNSSLKY